MLQTVCFGSWQHSSWPTCIWASNRPLSVSAGSWRSCHQRNPNTWALLLLSCKVPIPCEPPFPQFMEWAQLLMSLLHSFSRHLLSPSGVPPRAILNREMKGPSLWLKGALNLGWGQDSVTDAVTEASWLPWVAHRRVPCSVWGHEKAFIVLG